LVERGKQNEVKFFYGHRGKKGTKLVNRIGKKKIGYERSKRVGRELEVQGDIRLYQPPSVKREKKKIWRREMS